MASRQQALVDSYLSEYERNMRAGTKPTHTSRIVKVLSDGRWHDGSELSRAASWRFGGYLHELRKRGLEWESERSDEQSNVWYYRLIPEEQAGGEDVR